MVVGTRWITKIKDLAEPKLEALRGNTKPARKFDLTMRYSYEGYQRTL
jgi:hypothetical protein